MTSFATLDDYVALPRTTALAAARDGSRLVAGVGTLDKDATAWVTNLWEIDPHGSAARASPHPRREGRVHGRVHAGR
jgi:hypothetical protein